MTGAAKNKEPAGHRLHGCEPETFLKVPGLQEEHASGGPVCPALHRQSAKLELPVARFHVRHDHPRWYDHKRETGCYKGLRCKEGRTIFNMMA